MNRHGQTLILFVILIPILLGISALVVDTGVVISHKVHMKEVTKTVIRDSIDALDKKEQIESLLKKNNVSIDLLSVEVADNKISIQNEEEVDSIFGAIIGIKSYKVKINITAYIKDGNVIFE